MEELLPAPCQKTMLQTMLKGKSTYPTQDALYNTDTIVMPPGNKRHTPES